MELAAIARVVVAKTYLIPATDFLLAAHILPGLLDWHRAHDSTRPRVVVIEQLPLEVFKVGLGVLDDAGCLQSNIGLASCVTFTSGRGVADGWQVSIMLHEVKTSSSSVLQHVDVFIKAYHVRSVLGVLPKYM